MNKAARNERRKTTATWLNGAAIGAVPLMLLATAGIVYVIGIRSHEREMRLARERGELPPK